MSITGQSCTEVTTLTYQTTFWTGWSNG